MTSGASSMRVPVLRFAITASMRICGLKNSRARVAGSTSTGMIFCMSNRWTSSNDFACRAVTPSTVMDSSYTALANATVRRTTSGCASSVMMSGKPARCKRHATPVPRSPAPLTRTRKSSNIRYPANSRSVFAAMMKSLRCNPLILCVHHVTVTLPHSVRIAG